jgi:hypothetical protein
MEPDGLQSWSPMCERVNCNKREAVSLPDATIGIRKLCNPNGTALLGNYSDSLQAFKCPCTRTWLGCAICEWTSPANGIRFRPSNPLVKSYLVLHFLSPGHENKVMESNARASSSASSSTYGYSGDAFFEDHGDAFSESDASRSFSPSTLPTIEDVYSDVPQTEVAVATVIATIQMRN